MSSITLNKPSGGQLTLTAEDGATNETVTIPSTGFGKVLQVVHTEEPNVLSYGVSAISTNFINSLATTITPVSPNSKFLVRMNLRLGHNAGSLYGKMFIDGTQVGNGISSLAETSSTNSQWWVADDAYTTTAIHSYWGETLYSHSGDSPFTVTVAFRAQIAQTVYLNRAHTYFDVDRGSTTSYVTVMEVAQ